jgi:hypothetical protein
MAVFIALLSGISGAAALIAIFGVKTANDALGLLRAARSEHAAPFGSAA